MMISVIPHLLLLIQSSVHDQFSVSDDESVHGMIGHGPSLVTLRTGEGILETVGWLTYC